MTLLPASASGCAENLAAALANFKASRAVPVVVCPTLAPPPAAVLGALETAGKTDSAAANWTVALERFYEKQDACAAARHG